MREFNKGRRVLLWAVVVAMLAGFIVIPEIASAGSLLREFEMGEAPTNYTWNRAETTMINLNGDSIVVEGAGVVVEGSHATIVAAGAYSITGNLTDGQIVVDTQDAETVGLILNGATINSATSSPIYVANAENTVIVLADGTENLVSDGAAYVFSAVEVDEPNAAIFSSDDLILEGSGTLVVNGNFNDGIASKDDLTITGGTLIVTAVDDGIRGKDSLTIYDGQITVNAQGDGLKSDNIEDATRGYVAVESGIINVTAGGDAIDAQTAVFVSGGEFTLVAGGGSSGWVDETTSAKGIKAAVSIMINGGTFSIDAADDALHTNDSLVINGGSFNLMTADDGIHADVGVEINDGYVNIAQAYEGVEGQSITVNGGVVYVTTSDDGFNAANGTGGGGTVGNFYLTINGGYIVLNTGGDGVDSNGIAQMTNGTVIVNGPSDNRNSAIDVNGSFDVTGGFLVAVGSAGMAEAPSETSTQNALLLNFDTTLSAGTLVHIQSSDGNEVLTFVAAKEFQSMVVSSPEFESGATYEVYTGGSANGTAMDGLFPEGSYSGGTLYTSFTISGTVTQLGAVSNMGGPGGGRTGGRGGRG